MLLERLNTEVSNGSIPMALYPFLFLAIGIPPNWPGQCVLRIDYEKGERGRYVVLSYYGEGEVVEGITITEFRNLLSFYLKA